MTDTSKTEAEIERDYAYKHEQLRTFRILMARMQPVLIVLFLCIAVVLTARYLAGEDTKADIGFRFLLQLNATKAISVGLLGLFGFGGVVYGRRQKKLRSSMERRYATRTVPSSSKQRRKK